MGLITQMLKHPAYAKICVIPERWLSRGLLIVIFFGGAARLWLLDDRSIWSDELYSLWSSYPERAPASIIELQTQDSHPPLYSLILWAWFQVLPFEVGSARLLSALAGVGAVCVTYLLGKDLFGRRSGILAASLLSINNLAFFYSQEARAYSLMLFCAAFGLYAMSRAISRHSQIWSTLGAFSFCLLAYLHVLGFLFGSLYFVIVILIAVLKRRISIPGLSAAGIFLVLSSGVLPKVLFTGSHGFWTDPAEWLDVVRVLVNVSGGKMFVLVLAVLLIAKLLTDSRDLINNLLITAASILYLHAAAYTVVLVAYSYLVQSLLVPRFFLLLLPAIALFSTCLVPKYRRAYSVMLLVPALAWPTFLAPANAFVRRGHGFQLDALVDQVSRKYGGEPIYTQKPGQLRTLLRVYSGPRAGLHSWTEGAACGNFWLVGWHDNHRLAHWPLEPDDKLRYAVEVNRASAYQIERPCDD